MAEFFQPMRFGTNLPIFNLCSMQFLPPDISNVVSKYSNQIYCEGKFQSEFIQFGSNDSVQAATPQFHESTIIMVTREIDESLPFVRIFDVAGKELRRFKVVQDEDTLFNFKFTLIGNFIFLVLFRFSSIHFFDDYCYSVIVVYDLQGHFKCQWPSKFPSQIESIISCGENILLTTRDEHNIQVFDQNGNFCYKFGDYELQENNPNRRCSLFKWTHDRVMVSCWGTHRLYDASGKLLQVLTFADFGMSDDQAEMFNQICITQWNEIFILLFRFNNDHNHNYNDVLVFKHDLSKIEFQRQFVMETSTPFITEAFSLPNGKICSVGQRKIDIYE